MSVKIMSVVELIMTLINWRSTLPTAPSPVTTHCSQIRSASVLAQQTMRPIFPYDIMNLTLSDWVPGAAIFRSLRWFLGFACVDGCVCEDEGVGWLCYFLVGSPCTIVRSWDTMETGCTGLYGWRTRCVGSRMHEDVPSSAVLVCRVMDVVFN